MRYLSFAGPALAMLVALAAAGCASFETISPGTTGSEVRAAFGPPAGMWKSPDGYDVWEYPQGPLGTRTYMVSFGPDERVRDVRQVLNEETISRLRIGMTRDEVRRLIGRPGSTGVLERTNDEVWSWLYREWQTRKMELHVQFDRATGTVKGVTRFQIDPGGDNPKR